VTEYSYEQGFEDGLHAAKVCSTPSEIQAKVAVVAKENRLLSKLENVLSDTQHTPYQNTQYALFLLGVYKRNII